MAKIGLGPFPISAYGVPDVDTLPQGVPTHSEVMEVAASLSEQKSVSLRQHSRLFDQELVVDELGYVYPFRFDGV